MASGKCMIKLFLEVVIGSDLLFLVIGRKQILKILFLNMLNLNFVMTISPFYAIPTDFDFYRSYLSKKYASVLKYT